MKIGKVRRAWMIGLPYSVIFFCLLFMSSCLLNGRYVYAIMHFALAMFWLRMFIQKVRFLKLSDEFNSIMAEAEKRVFSGAPAGELLEMARDRLKRM